MIKYVLFDLDGTLLSTLESIAHHLSGTLESLSLGNVSVEDCRKFIGNGARKLVSRALAKNGVFDEGKISEALLKYNCAYDSDPIPYTTPYEGVESLIDNLYENGIVLGVVTNKPEPTAKKLIEHFFPGKFSFVRGGCEGVVLKPDPVESIKMLSTVGGKASECAFVGDTPVDIETGKNMKAALSIGVTWGFRSREELILSGADYVADNADEVLRAITEVI